MQTFWAGSEKRLAIVLRPRGGDWLGEELLRLKNDGIDVIVSMLEPQEASELGLAAEGALCARVGLSFRSFPVVDRDVPDSLQRFAEFARELLRRMQAGEAIGVHCRASIGRSSLLAASLLCLEGADVDGAFLVLSQARGRPVPDTSAQIEWVQRFADHVHA